MLKKLVAIIVAPIAVLGMTISISSLSSASAAIEGSNSTGSSVGTVPQCSWHLDGVSGAVSLTHGDATKYKGLDYAISGSSSSVDSYVAPVGASGKPSAPGNDDCSWYTSKASASVTISTSASPAFTSSSFPDDTSMNFSLTDSSNKLTATVSSTQVTSPQWQHQSPRQPSQQQVLVRTQSVMPQLYPQANHHFTLASPTILLAQH